MFLQEIHDGMGFLVRAASMLLGDMQAFLVSSPISLPRAVPAAGMEEAERPDLSPEETGDCSQIIANRTSLIINGQVPLSCWSSA